MIATDENIVLIMAMLRIDDTSDLVKQIIKTYTGSAEHWLKNTGITVDYSNEQIIDIVSMYVGKRYENPDGAENSNTGELALAAMAEQIRAEQLSTTTTGA